MKIVTDFDGTVIRCNSFPHWIKFALLVSLVSFRWNISARLLTLVINRKLLNLISHAQFKEQINDLEYPKDWAIRFCHRLKKHSSSSVSSLIEGLAAQRKGPLELIIATAAPSCYASYFGEVFFPHSSIKVLSSVRVNGCFVDNAGEEKVNYLKRTTCGHLAVFLTDSSDDLPVARLADKVYLCNPNQITIDIFVDSGVKFSIVRG